MNYEFKGAYGQCMHFDCPNRTEFGYCKSTACMNPKYNSFSINSNRTLTKEELEKIVEKIEKGSKRTL